MDGLSRGPPFNSFKIKQYFYKTEIIKIAQNFTKVFNQSLDEKKILTSNIKLII